MELQLHRHDWRRRWPDWTVAAAAGFVAGAVLMVLELLWATTVSGESPWQLLRMVAAIAMGPQTLEAGTFSVGVAAVALLTHYLLGVVFALVLAVVIAGFSYDTSATMIHTLGALFGFGLYLFNFHGMSQFFPWMADLRGWSTLIAHLVFGMTAAFLYWKFDRHFTDR
ncbi:MAG: hypothetical protein AB1430_03940 [Pseudomonadota bacterium]